MADKYTTSNFVSRFIGFDRMLGSLIIKIVYHIGLILIVLGMILAIAAAVTGMGAEYTGQPDVNPVFGVIGAILGGLVAIIVWRYICEISILMFQIYNRLGEIRDRLPEIEPTRKLASHT